jgi:hypothetical protein
MYSNNQTENQYCTSLACTHELVFGPTNLASIALVSVLYCHYCVWEHAHLPWAC